MTRPKRRAVGPRDRGSCPPAPHLGVAPALAIPPQQTKLLTDRLGGDASVWIVKDFLSSADIDAIHSLGPTGVRKEHDRYEGLTFSHDVWRFEKALKLNNPKLYNKVIAAMLHADLQIWRCVPTGGDKVSKLLHPEIEYIVYDAEECRTHAAQPPIIGPHVDNSSCVTMVALLSQRGVDFEGGVNRFEDGSGGKIGDGNFRDLLPNKGDALFFRGERCEHSLTEVTSGRRSILQIELCKKREGYH